jgi:ubiquinone/menaquinone biosynthesis C-methylase UbiE
MDSRLQLRVQRYGWDRAASVYDRAWADPLRPAQELLLEAAELQEGERVLETACGSGLVTVDIARAVGSSGEVLATDLSDGMLERARTATVELELDPVRFERMDAGALDLPDDTFDAALCSLGLMYVPDFGAAIREFARVVRPGGRAAAVVWGERRRCGWADLFPIVDARVKTEVCPLFFQLGTGDTLEALMREAGLQQVESRRIRTTLDFPTEERALEAAFAGGPVAMAYGRFEPAVQTEVHQEYLASIEAFRAGEGYRIPGEFVAVRGKVAA